MKEKQNKQPNLKPTTRLNKRPVEGEIADEAVRKDGVFGSIANKLSGLEQRHEAIGEHMGDVAKATRVIAGVATAGAFIAAPTGLTAVGVAIGITSAPFIVTAAPVLVAVAGAAATVSAAAHLYSKAQRRRKPGTSNK